MGLLINPTIEGMNVNASWAASLSKEAFVEHEAHQFPNYSPEDRKKLLEQAHDECVAAVAKSKLPDEPKEDGGKKVASTLGIGGAELKSAVKATVKSVGH